MYIEIDIGLLSKYTFLTRLLASFPRLPVLTLTWLSCPDSLRRVHFSLRLDCGIEAENYPCAKVPLIVVAYHVGWAHNLASSSPIFEANRECIECTTFGNVNGAVSKAQRLSVALAVDFPGRSSPLLLCFLSADGESGLLGYLGSSCV